MNTRIPFDGVGRVRVVGGRLAGLPHFYAVIWAAQSRLCAKSTPAWLWLCERALYKRCTEITSVRRRKIRKKSVHYCDRCAIVVFSVFGQMHSFRFSGGVPFVRKVAERPNSVVLPTSRAGTPTAPLRRPEQSYSTGPYYFYWLTGRLRRFQASNSVSDYPKSMPLLFGTAMPGSQPFT